MSTVEPDGGWNDGTTPGEPALQVHALAPDTFVIRQSLGTHYEGPFVYLLLGTSGALLLDTGAVEDPLVWPLRQTVDGIVDSWLESTPCPGYTLTVAHSHGHHDHTAGDGQFAGRADTTVVGASLDEVVAFFGLEEWPDAAAPFDLGGRALTVIPGPGHERAAIVVHDPRTGILLTGDTIYPGRLYVEDMPSYLRTLERLATLLETTAVTALLGGHVEMSTTPGEQFEIGSLRHPHEAPLSMSPSQFTRVLDRARIIADQPGLHRYDDVAIVNGREAVDAYFAAARS